MGTRVPESANNEITGGLEIVCPMSNNPTRPDHFAARGLAMTQAIDLHHDWWGTLTASHGTFGADAALRATATAIYNWVTGPAALWITIGTVVHQDTGQPTGTIIGGTPMQLHDDEQVALTVTVASAKGSVIPDDPATSTDDLTWTTDDSTVAALEVSADTRTCTVRAGVTGSTIVSVSFQELSATLAVDVIPGGAAVLTIGEGTPAKQ